VERPARLALLVLALLALPPLTGAQSGGDISRAALAPAFSGRYAFVLTVSGGCPPSMQVGPLTIAVNVTESTSGSALEVSGQSASPSELAGDGRFVLLRQVDTLHGAFGAGLGLGLVTTEGYRVWLRVMTDGSASTSASGRARASGTAFGEVEISLASDPTAEGIGNCPHALDHRWTLDPL
jgi:hypothetical protein